MQRTVKWLSVSPLQPAVPQCAGATLRVQRVIACSNYVRLRLRAPPTEVLDLQRNCGGRRRAACHKDLCETDQRALEVAQAVDNRRLRVELNNSPAIACRSIGDWGCDMDSVHG